MLNLRQLVLACLLLCCTPLWAAVWRVQPGQDVQAAINQAAAGDVVEVERGFYDQNLRIDKPMTLRGLNRPTLSGGQRGDTIRVTATDVVIEGLIVRDSGTELVNQHAGIYLQPGAHRAVVRDCVLVYNLFGLWIEKVN
ncbi:MAG: nitrous oxide reductase family maturation protein NosD, partial [Rhodoferax sp.]